MTEQQFREEYDSIGRLMSFCWENSYDIMEDIYDDNTRDEILNEELRNIVDDYEWYKIMDFLRDWEGQGEYWYRDPYGNWRPLDEDDYENYLNEVIERCRQDDLFDEESDDDEDIEVDPETGEIIVDDERDVVFAEEDFSMDELFGSSNKLVHEITIGKEIEEAMQEQMFEEFVVGGVQ